MPEHKYISERFERRTYIKGTFKGSFIGQLDTIKSDERYERFFDLEILEGEIYTTQDNIKKWTEDGEPPEFTSISGFSIRPPGELRVTLRYLDNSLKYFKVRLKELKLIHCRLSKQVYQGKEVLGTIEGDVSGYILHHDAIVEEATESLPASEPFTPGFPVEQQPLPGSARPGRSFNWLSGPKPLLHRFKSSPFRRYGCFSLLLTISGSLLLLGTLAVIKNWFMVFLILGVVFWLLPFICKKLFQALGLQFPPWAGLLGICLQVLFALFLLSQLNRYETYKKTGLTDSQQNVAEERLKKSYKDSFDLHYTAAIELCKQRSYEQAFQHIERASLFARDTDKELVNTERIALLKLRADKLVRQEHYSESLPLYSELIQLSNSSPTYLYKRAESYLALDNVRAAVNDLKRAIEQGDRPALLLHDKINPVKRRRVGTVTLCNDGSTSTATGRGACSHHGGVRDWNHPIYEEYRDY